MKASYYVVISVLFGLGLVWFASCGGDDDDDNDDSEADDDTDDDDTDDDDTDDDDTDDDSDDDVDDDDISGCLFMDSELVGEWHLVIGEGAGQMETDVDVTQEAGSCIFEMESPEFKLDGNVDGYDFYADWPGAPEGQHFILEGTIDADATEVEGTVDVDIPPDVVTGPFTMTKN